MKHTIFGTLPIFAGFVLAAILVLSGCASNKSAQEAVYEGAAQGYRGIIRVHVVMERGNIGDIVVVESSEDRAVGETAIEELTDLALMYNTTELDVIAGATFTSRGFLAAVENAIVDK